MVYISYDDIIYKVRGNDVYGIVFIVEVKDFLFWLKNYVFDEEFCFFVEFVEGENFVCCDEFEIVFFNVDFDSFCF